MIEDFTEQIRDLKEELGMNRDKLRKRDKEWQKRVDEEANMLEDMKELCEKRDKEIEEMR